MGVAEAARARLLAALRPWLAAEPGELAVELGLLRCRAVARRLELNAAALNAAAPASWPAAFERAVAAEVEIAASPWDAPALAAVVRGVVVDLTLREPAPKKRPDYKKWVSDEKKRVTASMDPQGELLHEMIEGAVNSLEDAAASIFSNVLLSCSQVRLEDVQIQVHYLDDSHVFIFRTKNLRFGPELVFRSSLFRGLVGSSMSSRKKNSLLVNCADFEFLLKENDRVDCITSLTDVSAYVTLENLQLASFGIHVPNAYFKFSPEAIPSSMVILDIASQKEYCGVRNGQELWKIAAQKLDSSMVGHRFSLHKVIRCSALWRRYVIAYVLLLSSVGYPSEEIIKRNCGRVSSNRKIWKTIRDHWKSVLDLEEKIPAEAIARARRAARSKLSVSQQSNKEFSKTLLAFSLLKVLSLILSLCGFLLSICQSVMNILYFTKNKTYRCHAHISHGISHDSDMKLQFSLHLGELSVTLLPFADHLADRKRQNKGNMSYVINLPSACLLMKSSCLLYLSGCTAQSLFFVIGELKTCLSGVPKLLRADNSIIPQRNSSFGETESAEVTDSKIILWSESASLNPFSGKSSNDSFSHVEASSAALLRSDMETLWSNWTKITSLYDQSGVMHHEKPFFIFEFKYSLVDPYKSISGFQQCRFTVGKLNIELDYLCTLSMYLLFRKFQHYKQLTGSIGRFTDLSNFSAVHVEPESRVRVEPESRVLDRLRSFMHRMKIVMLNAIPERTVQIGALVAGPSIQLMLERENLFYNSKTEHIPMFSQTNGKSCIVFNLAYVECAIGPSSLDLTTAPSAKASVKESQHEFICLKELQTSDILAIERSVSGVGHNVLGACFKFAGLTVLIDEANQQSPIFGPMSANLQLSTTRKYVHSMCATRNVLSVDLSGDIVGCVAFLYMDELFTICQVAESMHLVALSSDLVNVSHSQDFVRRLGSFCSKNVEGSSMEFGVSYVAQETVIDSHTELMVDMSLDLESIYIIFNGSRDKLFRNPTMFLNSAMNYVSSSPAFAGVATEELLDILASGVGFCIQSSSVKLLLDGQRTNFIVNFSGIRSAIFDNHAQMGIFDDMLQYRTMLSSSLKNMNQFILSKCMFRLCVGSDKDSSTDEKLQDESNGSNCTAALVGMCCCVEFEFNEVYIGDYNIYVRLSKVNQQNKQKISLLICDDLQKVKCKVQGGLIFLETLTLSKFVLCSKMHSLLLTDLLLWASSNLQRDTITPISVGSGSIITDKSGEREVTAICRGVYSESEESRLNVVKDLDVDLSPFSLTLAVADGSGAYQGLTLEAEMNLQRLNFGTKILYELKRLSISSTTMPKGDPTQLSDISVPHFRSGKSVSLPSQVEIQEDHPATGASDMRTYHSDAPSTSTSTGFISSEFSSRDSYIIRYLSASVKIEKKNLDNDASLVQLTGNWFGNGSVSGLEVAMALSSIDMISALFAPLRAIQSGSSTQEQIQTDGTIYQAQLDNIDHIIPDGAIVAIHDLEQQMYVSVRGVGGKYEVVGAYHYSLAGKSALFKVRHHKRWRLEAPCISLVSLYAKTDEGKEMSLNFSRGSDFVDISSVTDKPHSLWSTFPISLGNFEDDDDVGKSCKIISKHSYHLVNKKNNCGIAFVDGLLEFVQKPGNPFKVKIFNESLFSDVAMPFIPNMNTEDSTNLNVEDEMSCAVRDRPELDARPQYVNISIDKIVFTILHEVYDIDVFPLVQNCISDVCVVTQIFPSKIRILSSFKVSGQYFNAQRNMWEELISPITSYVFFRSRFLDQCSATGYSRTPLRFFFCLKQVDIFIDELSVDILLYLAGKLNLMGPYAVRSSAISPNCCKIENSSRLTLVCHFQNNGDAIVPGKKSASVFLRHLAFLDKLPHGQNVVSISLVKEGEFSTSSINVSLQDSGIFAWRTRVSSLKDSRSFSGPFVVVKVSQNSEEGLSLSVCPLLRIYNKSDFPLELRFQRPREANEEAAFVTLRSGDMVDESTGVFDAIDLSGGSKRALMSLALGNFLLSIRPEISEHSRKLGQSFLVKWSEDITGEKATRVSGVLEKLNYNLRRAFGVDSVKSFFSSLSCPVFVDGQHITDLHFLIHTLGRDVPLQPPNGTHVSDRSTPVALQFQREIFIYPTVQVYNFLQTDIHVFLTKYQLDNIREDELNFTSIGKQAMIESGSSAYFYVNPAVFNFSVTLISYGSKSKQVDSSDWVRRLQKQATQAQFFDAELEFFPGNYNCSLRLFRQDKGLLEVALFTKYTLHNTSEYPLSCMDSYQKSLPQSDYGKDTINLRPEHGCILPSKSMSSWFPKSGKVYISLLNEKASEAFIDLEVLSGFTEFFLEIQDNILPHRMAAFGMSLQSVQYDLPVPSQVVLIVPRYVISNESTKAIAVRQCFVEDDMDGMTVETKQRVTLQTWKPRKKREVNYFDSFLRKHRNVSEDSHIFIQFCPKETGYSWSGPICVSSIGHFFLKFRRSQSMVTDRTKQATLQDGMLKQFASLDVVQETSTFVLRFNKPPKVALPYRIENCLHEASIMYFQKDSIEPDILHPQESEQYAWDDLSLPHKLVVRIVDTPAWREIKIDKITSWKPFLKMRHNNGLNLDFSFNNGFSLGKQSFDESFGFRVFKMGYEVCTDGLTRVLRICEHTDIPKAEKIQRPIASLQFRVYYMCIHLLERGKSEDRAQSPSTILTARLQHVSVDSVITDIHKHVSAAIQSINVDEKWEGASFGSILRRSELDDATLSESILHMTFVLNSTNSSVKQVKYCSIILQPIDLKVDEETLMKLVPFLRTSLAPSGTPSTQFYFRHFEVHPIKIITSFRPGSPHMTYSSAQEALRALLHNVIKMPEISNSVVELNGVLLNHALVTFRELFLKCAQHYSWYILRAIYVTKGSSLLPPSFASIFDDSASSVLDVFFDPSDGSVNLPGLTIGMFKIISKNMKSSGFSGTKRYLGDLGKTVKTASSNALFAAVTEISDNIVKGAETNGFNGMVTGFHQGMLRLAMEPSVLGLAIMEGGPDRKIKLDRSPGLDELYVEGYLQAMLDVMYKQEYLRVRVIDDQVVLKNLPPNSSLINEIVENVKSFLVSKALLKGDASTVRPLRHLRNQAEWKLGPTVLTLCEHLFVSFAVRALHREATKFIGGIIPKAKKPAEGNGESSSSGSLSKPSRLWAVGRFAVSGMVAYIDGRLCRHIPNPIARRIVSGFLLSFIDRKDSE